MAQEGELRRNRRPAGATTEKPAAGKNQKGGAGTSWLFIFLLALLGPVVILVGVGVGVHYGSAAQETRLERHNLGVRMIEAAREHDLSTMRRLVEKGADLNFGHPTGGSTALHECVNTGNLEGLTLLLKKGANPSTRNHGGAAPIHIAGWCQGMVPGGGKLLLNKHCAMAASLLLKAGAEVNVAMDETGVTPLHQFTDHMHLPVVMAILDAGADPNAQMQDGTAALHIVGEKQDDEAKGHIIAALVEHGAKKDLMDYGGNMPNVTAVLEAYAKFKAGAEQPREEEQPRARLEWSEEPKTESA